MDVILPYIMCSVFFWIGYIVDNEQREKHKYNTLLEKGILQ